MKKQNFYNVKGQEVYTDLGKNTILHVRTQPYPEMQETFFTKVLFPQYDLT